MEASSSFAQIAKKSMPKEELFFDPKPKPVVQKTTSKPKPKIELDPSVKCKFCSRKRFEGEETCFECHIRQGKECVNFATCKGFYRGDSKLCAKCMSKCPTEGCTELRKRKDTDGWYPTCSKCVRRCKTPGCLNDRVKVEDTKNSYYKICTECFMKCPKCETGQRSTTESGFIQATCGDCYLKDNILCACGKRRGVYTENGVSKRYATCIECADPKD
jgi:hypothetical protein